MTSSSHFHKSTKGLEPVDIRRHSDRCRSLPPSGFRTPPGVSSRRECVTRARVRALASIVVVEYARLQTLQEQQQQRQRQHGRQQRVYEPRIRARAEDSEGRQVSCRWPVVAASTVGDVRNPRRPLTTPPSIARRLTVEMHRPMVSYP